MAASMSRLRDLGHSSAEALRLMKYGAWTLTATSCSAPAARISSPVSSETRTDCTQPSSSAARPTLLLNWMAPRDPPGFLGVPFGEPTVPKRNEDGMATPMILYRD